MATAEVENAIRKNIIWAKLPDELRIVLGGSQREYEKRILDYSIRNQLRYKDNIVRFVKKDQEDYYESLLNFSKMKMVLYPYHLSDILVRELRITPFTYYTEMIIEVMQSEKSYDSIPNFTAVDIMRILNIGRNQYIDLMNQNRANRRLFRRSKSIREILPQKPATILPIEPWFFLSYGCILENDIRLLSSVEKKVIDRLMDEGSILCGLLDKSIVQRLLSRGLVYLDVPVNSDDFVFVPTLDGFVMNRVQGDYFETLLYKIFVAIDGQNSIKELSDTINIDIDLVKNAISVFCRLGFAKKRVTGIESQTLHPTWGEYSSGSSGLTSPTAERTPELSLSVELSDLSFSLNATVSTDFDEDDIVAAVENVLKTDNNALSVSAQQISPAPPQPTSSPTSSIEMPSINKRIAFIFDSTLTAFLMMGNLSASLKNHAVTLFEVGKLSDDALDSFIDELQNVNFFAEGEAQRYSEHATTLLYTIQSLRSTSELDLIRGESLLNLESSARLKVIEKSYKMLISMAPIAADACCLQHSQLPHLGTVSVELTSPWFRLYLYELAQNGPPAYFLPLGTHLNRIPKLFWKCRRIMLAQGSHEPMIIPIENALLSIEEALLCAPIFLQAYSDLITDAEIVKIPFPFDDEQQICIENGTEAEEEENDSPKPFTEHPIVLKLHSKLKLDQLCGYLVLIKLHNSQDIPLDDSAHSSSKIDELQGEEEHNTSADLLAPSLSNTGMFNSPQNSMYSLNTFQLSSSVSKDPKKCTSNRTHLTKGESFDDYVLYDCVFGIPLFDDNLNKIICTRIFQKQILAAESFKKTQNAMQEIISATQQFIARFIDSSTLPSSSQTVVNNDLPPSIPYPTTAVCFDPNFPERKCQSQLIV